MSLKTYRTKRQFERTPEPAGKPGSGRGALRFVVQKHAASHLHYDFRLELDGVLKSWAVPKGPSLNPKDKRLAMMVEDHPLEYRNFEGIIPAGNYGAGSVIVWDEGTFWPVGTNRRAQAERALRDGLERGHVAIELRGTKLNGEFVLVHVPKRGDNAWLLIKKNDRFAVERDVTAENHSVRTSRTLIDVAAGVSPKRTARKRDPMPHKVHPMLAMLTSEPFNRAGWFFEIKWDGYRAIAEIEGGKVRLYSRKQQSLSGRFGLIVSSLERLSHDAVLDGEIVVVDADGKADFHLLQMYPNRKRGQIIYYAFDILYLDGRDLRTEPLRSRKKVLQRVVEGLPRVQFCEHVEERGIAFFEAAAREEIEGIVAKKATSPYRAGRRSRDWLKIKTPAGKKRHEHA